MEIRVKQTKQVSLILGFVRERFDDIAGDDTPISVLDEYIDIHSACWLRIDVNHDTIGVVKLEAESNAMMSIHPFMSRENSRFNKDAIAAALDWFDLNAPQRFKSLITNVPTCSRYAIIFARGMGFHEIGRYKDGHKKDGGYHDVVLFQRGRRHG